MPDESPSARANGQSGTSATTYMVDDPCRPGDEFYDGEPCQVVQMDHYGLPTPHLWCGLHAKVVGHVSES